MNRSGLLCLWEGLEQSFRCTYTTSTKASGAGDGLVLVLGADGKTETLRRNSTHRGTWGRSLPPVSSPTSLPGRAPVTPKVPRRLSRECTGFKLEQKSLNQDGTTVTNTKQERLSVEVRH